MGFLLLRWKFGERARGLRRFHTHTSLFPHPAKGVCLSPSKNAFALGRKTQYNRGKQARGLTGGGETERIRS